MPAVHGPSTSPAVPVQPLPHAWQGEQPCSPGPAQCQQAELSSADLSTQSHGSRGWLCSPDTLQPSPYLLTPPTCSAVALRSWGQPKALEFRIPCLLGQGQNLPFKVISVIQGAKLRPESNSTFCQGFFLSSWQFCVTVTPLSSAMD